MRYMTFGRCNGLRVSEYALGTANFGTGWGLGADADEAARMLDRFADAGGTFIDTADTYQAGESEKILGDLLTTRRDRFVLATKFSIGVAQAAGVLDTGNSRRTIMRAVENSLARLRTDRIDLLWVHFPDEVTPTEEIVRALDDLVRAGKILHAGLSNFPAWRTARAVTIAELRGHAPIAGVQFEYSLVQRTADREILPMAEALGVGVALWSPLGGGLLTGKYRTSDQGRLTELGSMVRTEDTAAKTAIMDGMLAVAADLGVPPARVAMAWLRQRAAIAPTALVPVIGPRSMAHLDDYLAALDVRLAEEQWHQLEELSRVPLGEPHDLLADWRQGLLGGPGTDFRSPVVPVA